MLCVFARLKIFSARGTLYLKGTQHIVKTKKKYFVCYLSMRSLTPTESQHLHPGITHLIFGRRV